VESAIVLAILRALDHAGVNPAAWRLGELFEPTVRLWELDLGVMLDDPLLFQGNCWPSAPIIQAEGGQLSLQEIRAAHIAGEEVVVFPEGRFPTGRPIDRFRSRGRFLNSCAKALLQTGLQLVRIREGTTDEWRHVVRAAEVPQVREGLKLFPPLLFLPYEGSTLLWHDGAINANHPFSRWLIEHAPALRKAYPALFSLLRGALPRHDMPSFISVPTDRRIVSVNGDFSTPRRITESINGVLDQLRTVDPGHSPSRTIYLKPEDFDQPAS
jgi:hypothetical protein